MVNCCVKILSFVLVLSGLILAQEEKEISTRQIELTGLKSEIMQLEKELSDKSAAEKKSLSILENYNKQNFLLNKLINSLRREEKIKQNEIEQSTSSIKKLEKEIDILKKNYAKYVVAIYKHGKPGELEGMLDAESFQQGLRRIKYLQKFSESRAKDLVKFKNKISELESARIQLKKEKGEKAKLAADKAAEENNLIGKLEERKIIVAALKTDKDEIKKEIVQKRQAEEKIKNLITKLVEEAERKRKEEAERIARLEFEKLQAEKDTRNKRIVTDTKKKSIIPQLKTEALNLSTANFAPFSSLRGRMIWPLAGGKVIRGFGENKNQKLNTDTMNYGVDIKASADMEVKAVAEGVVSAIDWIPGYGSVIILTHKGEYRTVYSHLSEIYISEGEKVKMGTRIAKVNESLEGSILHFEIWNSRNNQDPEVWLAKR
ncbi:MAG: hypothetical protein AUK34_09330 [Ignavibacteria bacterium CG2_30_36_16]|nr:MAG: hypothetical protein AUK34_09330 [Ignavibacteria bacterium CG2_30_36_16]